MKVLLPRYHLCFLNQRHLQHLRRRRRQMDMENLTIHYYHHYFLVQGWPLQYLR